MYIQYFTISFSGDVSDLEIWNLPQSIAPADMTAEFIGAVKGGIWQPAGKSFLFSNGSYSEDAWNPRSFLFRIPKPSRTEFTSIEVEGDADGACYALLEDGEYRYGVFGVPKASARDQEVEISFRLAPAEDPSGPSTEDANVRSDACFSFWRNGSEQFFPAAGAKLRFASKDVDTLHLPGIPAGTLAAGDSVTVKYRSRGPSTWKTVFTGTVESIVDRHGRGTERVNDVVCQGPWGKMNRLVFRQAWGKGAVEFSSPRIVLNQSALGLPCTMTEQVREILDFAARKCGFSVGQVSAGGICLPKDETRDMTCASALQRELRFFPKKIVRFDYSTATPTLHVVEPSGTSDAPYVASIPKTAREYEYTAHPVTGVDVYTADLDVRTGSDGTDSIIRKLSHQIYPADCDPDGLDVLHAYIPLAGGSASTSWESFESETEDLPSDLRDKSWWKTKHPRLANVAEAQITVNTAVRMRQNEYPRIAKSTAQDLKRAGCHSGVERFRADVTIKTEDDEEEHLLLMMDFLMTDAKTKTYTWQTGSSATAAESLPAGLAEAVYRQRAGALRNETMTVRLGDGLPTLGDVADGLFLQSFEVDCYDLTATLRFGQPEYLSVEDMRDLLNGFRQRGYASNAPSRTGDEEDQEEAAEPVGGIQPIAATEFSPGTKAKTTIKSSSPGKGSIVLDSSELPTGQIGVRTLTFEMKDGKTDKVYFLASSNITVQDTVGDGGGGGGGGGDDNPGDPAEGDAFSGDATFVSSMSYDPGTHQFKFKTITLSISNGLVTEVGEEIEVEAPVFTAVEHESEMD